MESVAALVALWMLACAAFALFMFGSNRYPDEHLPLSGPEDGPDAGMQPEGPTDANTQDGEGGSS